MPSWLESTSHHTTPSLPSPHHYLLPPSLLSPSLHLLPACLCHQLASDLGEPQDLSKLLRRLSSFLHRFSTDTPLHVGPLFAAFGLLLCLAPLSSTTAVGLLPAARPLAVALLAYVLFING